MKPMSWTLIFLVVMLPISSTDLVITRPPRDKTVLENKRLRMHCKALGQPMPTITWYHNDTVMPKLGLNYKIRDSGTLLRFDKVRVADRGIYKCKAESGREAIFSDPVTLTVQAEVTIIKTQPTTGRLTIPYNSGIRLSCMAGGIPAPAIQWRKNDESIINPREHGVKIVETWQTAGTILVSVLTSDNVTVDTKFECEAVNEHFWGPSIKHKIFTIRVESNEDMGESKRAPAVCAPYNGTICASVLGANNVFYNSSLPVNYQEMAAKELIEKMMSIDAKPMIQERCNGHGQKFICNYIFPPCESPVNPKPVPVCRESCIAVQDLLCYVQWPQIQNSQLMTKLPNCDNSLPSKRELTRMCTEAQLFDREEHHVTSECYKDRGRWYNGTINVTRTGKPCQRWSVNQPHKHARPPEVYRELEDSENYCRNPGAEEESPWCYIDIDNPAERWETCDVPSCDVKEVVEDEVPWVTIVIVVIVSVVGVFIVSLLALLCYHVTSQRQKDIQYKSTPQDDLEIDIQKLPANMSYHVVDEPIRLNPKLQAFEYPRNDIVYIRDIGQGAFGRVFEAKAPNLTKGQECQLIAVKMLKEDASEDLQVDFEREASLMAEFNHPNIVKFLGVCAIGKPMCLLFEYMSKGDLNDYLRMSSPDQYIIRKQNARFHQEGTAVSLDTVDQLDIARQIAAGMVYLSEKNYVHRDLATRNCLISENLTVKISDFGLARSVHRLEYYKGSDNDAIPIRWMPLESILYNKFSVESDVWSFGVLLWEVFTFALQPYYGMTHEEVVEFLKEGKNLVCPENTPQQVYELMVKCWNRKPLCRPRFQALHKTVSALYEELMNKKEKECTEIPV